MTAPSPAGKLVVLSGPSGVGKTTVLRKLMSRLGDRVRLSVSATTRPPRPSERDGIDYYFLTPEEFEHRRQDGQFLECCEVFASGYWYGTLLSEVIPSLEAGKSVILEIDVEGARTVRERFPEAVTIFLRPSSLTELERQLRDRGTESDAAVQRRLEVAQRELALADEYRYHVVNDVVDDAVSEIGEILNESRGSTS